MILERWHLTMLQAKILKAGTSEPVVTLTRCADLGRFDRTANVLERPHGAIELNYSQILFLLEVQLLNHFQVQKC